MTCGATRIDCAHDNGAPITCTLPAAHAGEHMDDGPDSHDEGVILVWSDEPGSLPF